MPNKYGLPTIGDSRTIGQYKNFGDWAQNRGGGTLDAIANLFKIGGGISGDMQQNSQNEAMKQALMRMANEKNILPNDQNENLNKMSMPQLLQLMSMNQPQKPEKVPTGAGRDPLQAYKYWTSPFTYYTNTNLARNQLRRLSRTHGGQGGIPTLQELDNSFKEEDVQSLAR